MVTAPSRSRLSFGQQRASPVPHRITHPAPIMRQAAGVLPAIVAVAQLSNNEPGAR